MTTLVTDYVIIEWKVLFSKEESNQIKIQDNIFMNCESDRSKLIYIVSIVYPVQL